MKIAVMGSGGLGGLYGGRLAHAGYDVTFIARGAHMLAMKEQGLLIADVLGRRKDLRGLLDMTIEIDVVTFLL